MFVLRKVYVCIAYNVCLHCIQCMFFYVSFLQVVCARIVYRLKVYVQKCTYRSVRIGFRFECLYCIYMTITFIQYCTLFLLQCVYMAVYFIHLHLWLTTLMDVTCVSVLQEICIAPTYHAVSSYICIKLTSTKLMYFMIKHNSWNYSKVRPVSKVLRLSSVLTSMYLSWLVLCNTSDAKHQVAITQYSME